MIFHLVTGYDNCDFKTYIYHAISSLFRSLPIFFGKDIILSLSEVVVHNGSPKSNPARAKEIKLLIGKSEARVDINRSWWNGRERRWERLKVTAQNSALVEEAAAGMAAGPLAGGPAALLF